jgi:hypothetical protein
MRRFQIGATTIAVSMILGCGVHHLPGNSDKSGLHPERKVDAHGIACVMQSGGRDVLRLSVAPDTKCKASDGAIDLVSHDQHIYFWMVKGAKSVNDVIGRVPERIKDEFRDFNADSTTDITVARSPMKRLVGSGTEADDGDPGRADVVVFQAGENVFVACVHGEHLDAAQQQWMTTILQTAQAP